MHLLRLSYVPTCTTSSKPRAAPCCCSCSNCCCCRCCHASPCRQAQGTGWATAAAVRQSVSGGVTTAGQACRSGRLGGLYSPQTQSCSDRACPYPAVAWPGAARQAGATPLAACLQATSARRKKLARTTAGRTLRQQTRTRRRAAWADSSQTASNSQSLVCRNCRARSGQLSRQSFRINLQAPVRARGALPPAPTRRDMALSCSLPPAGWVLAHHLCIARTA